MTRYAIYDIETGRLHADSGREPRSLPEGMSYTEIPDSDEGLMWDDVARDMITRPPKIVENTDRDGFWRLQQDSRFKSLSTAQKTRIMELLETYFARVRYD